MRTSNSNRSLRGSLVENGSKNWPVPYPPLTAILLTGCLFYLRFGYAFGVSDQDEFLPYLFSTLDQTLYLSDWFVQLQVDNFNIRTLFMRLVWLPSLLLPVSWSVLLIYLLSWMATALALYRIAYLLRQDSLVATAFTFLAMVMTPQWTLGGNDIVDHLLTPSMVAWSLVLWGFYAFLLRRYVAAGMLIGVATWVQALVGLHLAFVLTLILLYRRVSGKDKNADQTASIIFCGVFALFAAPIVGLLLWQSLQGVIPDNPSPSTYYIIAQFRNPHHYLPTAFPLGSYVRWGVLFIPALMVLIQRRKHVLFYQNTMLPFFSFCVLVLLLATVFTTLYPALFIAKLQFFKLTVWLKLGSLLVLTSTVAVLIPKTLRVVIQRTQVQRISLIATLLLAIALTGFAVIKRDHTPSPRALIAQWAKNSDKEAVFLVPPSWDTFRIAAQRAIVVNYKAFPYQDVHMHTWYTRLHALTQFDAYPDIVPPNVLELDTYYFTLDPEQLVGIVSAYNVDYLIQHANWDTGDTDLEAVFEASPWAVYRITSE